jgi:hypothetical protein
VVLRRSIRILVPRLVQTGPLPRGARISFQCTNAASRLAVIPSSAVQPVDPGLFSRRLTPGLRRPASTARHDPNPPDEGIVRPCIQRPNASSGPIRVHTVAPQNPVDPRQTSPSTAASTGWRSVMLEPFWERPAGTQTHSRRTGSKLGQDRDARQGLVRVPESNTKYGGKPGKTGVSPAPVLDPSISESSGIPKPKNLFAACARKLRPLFTGRRVVGVWVLRWRDSGHAVERARLACRRADGASLR